MKQMIIANSLWHLTNKDSAIKSEVIPDLPDLAILRSLYSLISTGTERIVSKALVPLNMHADMHVPYMMGDFRLPIKYGYSVVAQDKDGKLYHVMHPHQDIIQVGRIDLTPIPHHIPAKRATLLSNLETAFNGYWDGMPEQNDRILIAGFGLIGALLAIWIKLKGHQNIKILEFNEHRKKLAQKLGFSIVDDRPSLSFDLLYNTTSNQTGLQFCIDHANMEGRIIEMSWYGSKEISLKLGERFHINRLSIKASQVSSIPLKMKKDWNFESRKQEVINMLNHDLWDQVLDTEISLESAVQWFDKIRSGPINPLSLIIKY